MTGHLPLLQTRGVSTMTVTSLLVSRWMHLPPAYTPDVVVTRDIQVPMPDGVILLADHYSSRNGIRQPTILIRSPYGRRGLFGAFSARFYAERGYQVLIQSCRGTGGSGGEFRYARNEHDDGLATIEWIKRQDWFSGELAMVGASYLGFVQWAVAADAGPELKALVPQITAADFGHVRFQGGSFTLETSLGWSTMMATYASSGLGMNMLLGMFGRSRRLEKAYRHLPLGEADRIIIGHPTKLFQNLLLHGPDDDYWKPIDFSARVGEVTIPIYLMGGWYDIFLDWQLKDYQALRAAGKHPYLLIGPWVHGDTSSYSTMTRETLAWLQAHLKGNTGKLREAPVRLFVMGANQWRNFSDWPPPAQNERWYLQPGAALAPTSPPISEPDRYRYDPADPTPAVGGNSLGSRKHMGAKDNRKLEARSDVLVYTSAILDHEVEVIGPITADLYVRSSLQHTDFFARLCVVEPSGKSINLCDGIIRLTPDNIAPQADGSLNLQIHLWPTAYHFRRGQCIRLQVSSGAHPRFVRNPGTGETLATATKLQAAEQSVYHDPEHPSAILLPVI
jgi:putative CocE/NonD family hydrolase